MSSKTGLDRTFYYDITPDFVVKPEPFYVIIITLVIHYCMSGLKTNCDFATLGLSGKAISGLYAASEMDGGVHGSCKWMFGVKGELRARALPRPAQVPLRLCRGAASHRRRGGEGGERGRGGAAGKGW